MKRMVSLVGLVMLVQSYSWCQNEKDTIVTTIAAKNASVQLRADIFPDYIELKWIKGPDDFIGYFELYRSADGMAYNIIKQFQPETFSNTSNSFFYRDEDPLRDKNYYRLVAYDKFTQEKRTVELEAVYKNQSRKVQPSLVAKGSSQLNVVNYDGEELRLFVYNSTGTQLFQKVVASSVINIYSDNLSSGMYVYQLVSKKQLIVSSGKFIVQ